MEKDYTSHLCTFMGREENLKILLPYIEGALRNNAVDNYWFIDMTRKRSDHELIKRESARLNELFPGRVHLYNSEERAKIIDDKDKISKVSGNWDTFYKFLNRFNDNDIIAKCDDDTYYIDISTLKAAFELRWKNKKPYLMHANAINNGVAAYHQNKKGIWSDKETSVYPPLGLSGPLFSHPEVACAHHKKFTEDMVADPSNIDKYKLGKNVQFSNRVSINFIFMLGRDRHELSKITYQDEYDTSCKYPQREDRPNLLIGDFTMAHHTYGNQEPTMERLRTDEGYKRLMDKLDPANTDVEHQAICETVNATTTITMQGKYLTRAWVEKNTYAIRNPLTQEFISLDDEKQRLERLNADILRRKFARTKDFKKATLFNIDFDKPSPIWLTNSAHLLKCPNKEDLARNSDQYLTFPNFGMSGVANYLESDIYIERTGGNKCKFYLNKLRNYCLAPKIPGEGLKKNDPEAYDVVKNLNFFEKDADFEWELVHVGSLVNNVVPMIVNRQQDFYEVVNDSTTAWTQSADLPDCRPYIDFVWSLFGYIWEMIPVHNKPDTYWIKLVADDKDDKYLFYNGDKIFTGGGPDEWEFVDQAPKYLKHVRTGKYLSIEDNEWCMVDSLAELAMCPLK